MTNTATKKAATDAEATELLPALPDGRIGDGDGWDWMEAVAEAGSGWQVLPGLSIDKQLGEWPLYIVAVYTDAKRGVYGVATCIEGDVEASGFTSRKARHDALVKHIVKD